MKIQLYPDPGHLPTKPEPQPGTQISIEVDGYPPYKDIRFSIRNPKHPKYDRFVALRKKASTQMRGHKWSSGPIQLDFTLFAPELEPNKDLIHYVGGIMDTLDGSHGQYFTYLPIICQDDCQVVLGSYDFNKSKLIHYVVKIKFLSAISSK